MPGLIYNTQSGIFPHSNLIDPTNPVNWQHPLNQGLLSNLKVIGNPGWVGSATWHDLVRGGGHTPNDAILNGTLGTNVIWGGKSPPGGTGSIKTNGVSGYTSSTIPAISGLAAATICGWMYRTVSSSKSCFGLGGSSPTARFNIFVDGATTYFDSCGVGTAYFGTSNSLIGWTFYANVFRPSAVPLCYINAVARSVSSGGGTPSSTLTGTGITSLWVGREITNGFVTGNYDDIRVYNRSLSGQEIAAIYALSRQGYPGVLNYLNPIEYSFPTLSDNSVASATGSSTASATSNVIIQNTGRQYQSAGVYRNESGTKQYQIEWAYINESVGAASTNSGTAGGISTATAPASVLIISIGTAAGTSTSSANAGVVNTGTAAGTSTANGVGSVGYITYDASSNSGYQSTVTSLSWSHTWNGNNRFLSVDISTLGTAVTVVSPVTYGGAACTFVGGQNVGSNGRVECWRICQYDVGAPAAGTNTISVTLSGSASCAGTAVSYTGVNQNTPTEDFTGNSGTNSGTAVNATVSVTTIANNDWVHAALSTNQNSGIASSQTSRNIVAGLAGTGADADTGPLSPMAQTMTWTGEGVMSTWAVSGYGVRPISASNILVGNASGNSTANGVSAINSTGTATGTSSAVGISTELTLSVGTALGTSTANGVSTELTLSVGTATGTSSAVGISTELTLSTGTATGTSSAASTSTEVTLSTGTATGTSSASSTSTEIALSTGTATGTSSAASTSTEVTLSTGTATGTSSASSTSTEIALSTGTATGTSSAASTSTEVTLSTGTATGTSSASSTSTEIALSTGTATGTSSAASTSTEVTLSTGIALGASTTNGIGASFVKSTGIATGTSSVAGTSTEVTLSIGIATGTSSASGSSGNFVMALGNSSANATGSSLIKSTGTTFGTSTTNGTSTEVTLSTGHIISTSTANGTSTEVTLSTGITTGTSSATGTSTEITLSVGLALGTSTANGINAGIALSTGHIISTSTANGTSTEVTLSTGITTGTSSATGTSTEITLSVGLALGTSTTNGINAGIALSTGHIIGTSTANGVSTEIASSVGTALGNSTANSISTEVVLSLATAQGLSTAIAVSLLISHTGNASGSSQANGMWQSIVSSIGLAQGGSSATGFAMYLVKVAGTASGISAANGAAVSAILTVGTAAGSSQMIGIKITSSGTAQATSSAVGAGTSQVPAIGTAQVSFFLSGGTNNSDPTKSLGGPPSTQQIYVSLDNLFDTVSASDAANGANSYRCMYIFNEGSSTIQNVGLSVNQPTTNLSVTQLGIYSATAVQSIVLGGNPTGGTFALTYIGVVLGTQVSQTTNAIPFVTDPIAMADNIETALNDLTLLGTITATATNTGTEWDYVITFGGALDLRYHNLLVIEANDITGTDITLQSFNVTEGGPVNAIAVATPFNNQPPWGITFSADTLPCGMLEPFDGIGVWLQRATPASTVTTGVVSNQITFQIAGQVID